MLIHEAGIRCNLADMSNNKSLTLLKLNPSHRLDRTFNLDLPKLKYLITDDFINPLNIKH